MWVLHNFIYDNVEPHHVSLLNALQSIRTPTMSSKKSNLTFDIRFFRHQFPYFIYIDSKLFNIRLDFSFQFDFLYQSNGISPAIVILTAVQNHKNQFRQCKKVSKQMPLAFQFLDMTTLHTFISQLFQPFEMDSVLSHVKCKWIFLLADCSLVDSINLIP